LQTNAGVQAQAVQQLLQASLTEGGMPEFTDIHVSRDYYDKDRFVVATKA
jgi:hypothetical protein